MATSFPVANPWTDNEGLNAAKLYARITQPLNDLAAQATAAAASTSGGGTYTGTTDSSGFAIVTHSLGYTPTRVMVVSTPGTTYTGRASIMGGVDSITATTFRVRMFTLTLNSGQNFFLTVANVLPITFDWQAFK